MAEAGDTSTVEHSEMTIRKSFTKASGLFIPGDRIQHSHPTLPASAYSLADVGDRKSGLNSAEETLIDLNKRIKKQMVKHKRLNPPTTNATIEQAYCIYGGVSMA